MKNADAAFFLRIVSFTHILKHTTLGILDLKHGALLALLTLKTQLMNSWIGIFLRLDWKCSNLRYQYRIGLTPFVRQPPHRRIC